MQPVVSIITPTKNRLERLQQTMATVASQTFVDWEHVIVDDGSDDGTAEVVTRSGSRDPRIRYIPRPGEKGGANVCRNLGIREAQGEFVIMLDSDDLLRPACLENRVRVMRENPILDFAVFRAGVFMNTVGDLPRLFHPQEPGDDLLRFLSHDCVWEITSPIWRKPFLEKVGGFDETLRSMQDLELHVRALCADARYICFKEVDHDISWHYDFTRTSVRHVFDKSYLENAGRIRATLRSTVEHAGLLTWSRERALAGLCFATSESWVRAGRLGPALRTWSRGSRELGASGLLRWAGMLMLTLRRMGNQDSGLVYRIVNKWKGWVRFRQEPALKIMGSHNGE